MITFAPLNYISRKVMKRRWNELLHVVGSRLVEHAKPQKDFEQASTVLAHNHVHLSAGSLKRLWGYLTGHEKPSTEFLNRLALFAGFQDWESLRKTFLDEETPRNEWRKGGVRIAECRPMLAAKLCCWPHSTQKKRRDTRTCSTSFYFFVKSNRAYSAAVLLFLFSTIRAFLPVSARR